MTYYEELRLSTVYYLYPESREKAINDRIQIIENDHNEIVSISVTRDNDSFIYGITYRYVE